MLLGFVRVVPDPFGAGCGPGGPGAGHLRTDETLQRVKPRASDSPFILAVPRESLAQRFGDAPSVRIPESGEQEPCGRRAQCLNELPPQQPKRDRVEQEHTFAGECDDATLGREMKQLMNVEVRCAHQASVTIRVKLRVQTIISIDFHDRRSRSRLVSH